MLLFLSHADLDAESLGREVLSADPAILRVLVLDKQGDVLARVYSEEYPQKARLGKDAEEKVARLDILTIQMFQQVESIHGSIDFILLAYKGAKVMLMHSKKHGVFLAARILRSANAEYLHAKVEPILR